MGKVCFLGTGKMGFGMAARLLEYGHEVRVYNRTKEKALPLEAKGAVIVDTPKQAAAGADALIAMVGDDSASRSVWLGEDGALAAELAPQTLIIECSTISHDWVMELSALVEDMSLSYLDCPVTGLPEAAAKGELTLFLGGDQATIERAQPYINPLCAAQIHFGEIGAGIAYKLIVNLMGSIQIIAAAEGMLVAEKAGLDLSQVAKALAVGGTGSPQVARNSKLMADSDHENDVLFDAWWRLKDTHYGVNFANKMGQDVPLGKLTEALFQKLIEAGFSKSAESKIIDILRDRK